MVGGGAYEQMTVTKVLVSAPPDSFAMLQGEYKFSPVAFWAKLRPLTILLFVVALSANWQRQPTRNFLVVAFGLDLLVTTATFLYFAPEVGLMLEDLNDPSLADRAHTWYRLNFLRLIMFYAVGALLLIAFKKRSETLHPS